MWTNEQIEAINITNINTTVTASAGAGKTAVLVERLMKRILKDNISVDSIVSLTFTDAAAAEMKNRLMSALLDELEKDPTNEYLNEQITLLPSANITTIHSFCLSILKDYYYVLNLDPDSLNNILTESDKTEITENSFKQTLLNYDNDIISEVLEKLSGSAMNFSVLKNMIEDLSDKANGTVNPHQFLDDSILIYDDFDSLNDIPEPFSTMFWTYHQDMFTDLKNMAYTLSRTIDSYASQSDVEAHQEWISLVISNTQKMEAALNHQEYNVYMELFEDNASLKNGTIRGQKDYTVVRSEYFTILNDIAKTLFTEKELLDNLRENKSLTEHIVEMTKMFNDYYNEAVTSLNKISFDDMETLAYKLLSANNQEVAKQMSTQITDILIDEFQDTNYLQNEIVKLLSNGRNIFRVGDVKQSIYRFRGAEPSIMQDLINQEDSDTHKTISLSNNFRSKHAIVEYNNHFFNHLMNLETFSSKYTDSDYVTVGTDNQKQENKNVKLTLINTHTDAYDDLDDDYRLSKDEFKANYIAAKISEHYKKDPDKLWSKYTVLVDSHNRKLSLRSAFEKANIPYFIAFPDGLYKSFGVSTISAYLKLINDPTDEISLMAILINLYGYTEDDITREFLTLKSLTKVSNSLNPEILKKVYNYNNTQNTIKITSIVNDIYAINNFYENVVSKQSRTNLDLFYQSVVEYDQNNTGVYGFIKQMEQDSQAKASEASSLSSEDNVVNVMTIHNSKGLQFDTVFLFSKSLIRDPQQSNGYSIHPKYGLALKTLYLPERVEYENMGSFLIKYFYRKEQLEEEMRKLYVALTRAQNNLYIIDTIKDSEEYEKILFDYSLVNNRKGYTTWIQALNDTHHTSLLEFEIMENFEYNQVAKPKYVEDIIIHNAESKVSPTRKSLNTIKVSPLDLNTEFSGSDFGTMIHNTLEHLPNGVWTTDMITSISPDINEFYLNKLLTLNNHDLFKEISNYDVHKEYPFITKNEFGYQRGIIDYLSISDDKVYIVDFKTDNLESEHEFIERYQEQLHFYKASIENHFKDHEILTYIYSFKLDSFISL